MMRYPKPNHFRTNECSTCGGSGGGLPPCQCPSCHGTGTAVDWEAYEDAMGEAADRAYEEMRDRQIFKE